MTHSKAMATVTMEITMPVVIGMEAIAAVITLLHNIVQFVSAWVRPGKVIYF